MSVAPFSSDAGGTVSRRLHIAIVSETFAPEVNGVAMTLGRFVDGLLAAGHVVQLVRPRQQHEESVPRDGLEQVLVRGLPVPGYAALRFGVPSRRRLRRLWSEQRPDVVHVVTEGPLGWSGVAAARDLGLPLSSSFHTNFDHYSQHYGVGLLRQSIESYLRRLHNRCGATMVPTHALQAALQMRGYTGVRVVSRGVDTALFNPARRSYELRAQWGAAPTDPVLLLVGRLAPEKNVSLVLEAFAAVRQRVPQARLVLVGDGPMRKALQQACPEAYFAGVREREDLASHYASADLFLFPSLSETFGNVVQEALASGLAVQSYAHAAAQELIRHQDNGLLVTAGDAAAFIAQAQQLAQDVALQWRLRGAAAQSVAARSWSAVCDSFEAVLREVMAAHAGAPAAAAAPASGSAGGAPAQQRLPHTHPAAQA